MRRFLLDLRYRLEYVLVIIPYHILRCFPQRFVKGMARVFGFAIWLMPLPRKIVKENLRTAFPEMTEKERCRIARASFFHMMWNILEFVWVTGFPERIRKCYCLSDETARRLKKHAEAGERCIFVNPHLGSWEASGVSAPFFADLNMIAIAKPVHNPYLNALLNSGSREQTKGLKVVFSRGAVRAALTALRNGQSIGTLVDQNTRVRDGGEFVDFFGLPVPSSTAPAMLKRYCDAHDIPVVIIFGTSVRLADGRNTALTEYLSKPFDDYADDREVLQELLQISERYIRQYPEQYLWFYKRFQHIKPDTPPEIRKRYPSYARIPTPHFFSKAKRK